MFDKAVRNLALLAIAPLLGMVVPAAARAAGGMPLPPTADTPVSVVDLMSQVVTKTNQQRHRHGCAELEVDQNLIVASARQSWYMARTRNFSHLGWGGSTFVERARVAGYEEPAGENIAWGYGTAEAVMRAWMHSPGHRENILNCGARSIGTGVTYAADGTPYYTEVFGWD
ncbi:MAG: hypothetical protein QOE51_4754 [Actinoplanes sp.]|nr:hypothetical protein [Actinoplanes sp.]